MRRIGMLIDRIADRSNLAVAFHKAASGKRARPAVISFANDLDRRLAELSVSIREGTVPVGGFEKFQVFDPKRRIIHAAPFGQRVLHHAIFNVCGPEFERGAISRSCACRKGMGNRSALGLALRFASRHRYFLKLDIRKYFDSVDHGLLKELFSRRFKDQRFLRLLDRIIDSYQTMPGKGLPIGTLCSQYFANHYLDGLDRFVTEELKCPA